MVEIQTVRVLLLFFIHRRDEVPAWRKASGAGGYSTNFRPVFLCVGFMVD